MSVHRVEKINNYTLVDNDYIQSGELSLKAKGLLTYMLSLPDNWEYSLEGLYSSCKDGKSSLRNTLKELIDKNYLIIERIRDENGLYKYNYQIYEKPSKKCLKTEIHPDTGFRYMDNRYIENQTQINTNIQNTNIDKYDKCHNRLTMELINSSFIDENDINIFKYDELFNSLLNEYDYKTMIVYVKYIIKVYKGNKELDEYGEKINDKFAYFRTSLINNLNKLKINLDWGN